MTKILELYESGFVKPIAPMARFDAAKVEDSMRFMQKDTRMGKVIIDMPENLADFTSTTPKQKLIFREDASYLLAGGLGGLGQATAVWMAESGATESESVPSSGFG